SDRDKRVESAKISITALLKSWSGFLLLLNPSINGISTIINMLPLTEPYIQCIRQILEILYSSFHLKIPQWTDDYRIAIASVGKILAN
uniref:Rapamycin-insensitive companion of mTOR N-terminal domain-containing protein n=1 Tax=Amphimedon queenslandica TaxID=400682 RepID=A0A1X7T1D7_AMPQE